MEQEQIRAFVAGLTKLTGQTGMAVYAGNDGYAFIQELPPSYQLSNCAYVLYKDGAFDFIQMKDGDGPLRVGEAFPISSPHDRTNAVLAPSWAGNDDSVDKRSPVARLPFPDKTE